MRYNLIPAFAHHFVRAAVPLATTVCITELDCRKSWQRTPSAVLLDEALPLSLASLTHPWGLFFREGMGREPAYYELFCRFDYKDKELCISLTLTPEVARPLLLRYCHPSGT